MAEAIHPLVHEALACLKSGERDEGARLLYVALERGEKTGKVWGGVAQLLGKIGEIDGAIEASRRFAATQPIKLSALLQHWRRLIDYGRDEQVAAEITRLPEDVQKHPSVLHVRGQLAAQLGSFDEARTLYNAALARSPQAVEIWFSLSGITSGSGSGKIIDDIRKVAEGVDRDNSEAVSRIEYAIGRCLHELGDYADAMAHYTKGAESRRASSPYNRQAVEQRVDGLIAGFTASKMRELVAPVRQIEKVIFVGGLPRSGTTLTEQILVSNEAVAQGAEIDLVSSAFIPTRDYSFDGAMAYQNRHRGEDPWGQLAQTYERMVEMRFRTDARVVDKTLSQSHLMGLMVHCLPECPVIWVRRSPEDVALSCFRTYFSDAVAWSWSFSDIGHFMRMEDRLFEHWTSQFPDRFLVLEYEELVSDPQVQIERLCGHCRLDHDPAMVDFHLTDRAVRTASLGQVRQPISKNRIGGGGAYRQWMDPFWQEYQQA